ncbi:MAG: hypothetical protein ACYC49_13160 [Ignavibacteriaceae bacterium]
MMKCYITGIALNSETAYVLNVARVKGIMKDLKNKHDRMEKMISELGVCDNVEIVDKKGKRITQRRKRLVCKQLAEAYNETYCEDNIFIVWKDWVLRKNNNHNEKNKN